MKSHIEYLSNCSPLHIHRIQNGINVQTITSIIYLNKRSYQSNVYINEAPHFLFHDLMIYRLEASLMRESVSMFFFSSNRFCWNSHSLQTIVKGDENSFELEKCNPTSKYTHTWTHAQAHSHNMKSQICRWITITKTSQNINYFSIIYPFVPRKCVGFSVFFFGFFQFGHYQFMTS